jgi:hypothetical protein
LRNHQAGAALKGRCALAGLKIQLAWLAIPRKRPAAAGAQRN